VRVLEQRHAGDATGLYSCFSGFTEQNSVMLSNFHLSNTCEAPHVVRVTQIQQAEKQVAKHRLDPKKKNYRRGRAQRPSLTVNPRVRTVNTAGLLGLTIGELSDGRLSLKKRKWLERFPVAGQRFVIIIGDQRLDDRIIDENGRVYIGSGVLKHFQRGDILKCYKDERGEYHIEKDETS